MSKKLSKALRTDLNEMAALLRSKGRGRDTILAHINPEEAALLKRRGGSGTINPETGIMEFEDGSFDWFSPSTWFGGGSESPTPEAPAPEVTPVQEYAPFGGEATETVSGGSPQQDAGWFQDYMKQFSQPVTETFTDTSQQLPMFSTGGYDPYAYQKSLGAPTTGEQAYIKGTEGLFQTPSLQTLSAQTPAQLQDINAYLDKSLSGAAGGITDQQKKELADKGIDWTKVISSAIPSLLGNAGKFGLGYAMTKPIQRTQTTAAQESAKLGKEIGALGAPTKAVGTQMLSAAESGQLTPVQRRNVQALRAQQRQALSRAGITSGTAQLQSEANVQRLANEYVQSNIQTALNMINFGDKYVAQGIRAGYDANQQANQAANIFYQNLFRMLGGTSNPFGG